MQLGRLFFSTFSISLRNSWEKELTQLVLDILPEHGPNDGVTLTDLQEILQRNKRSKAHQLRPAVLLEAIRQLQFAGYVASTANEPGDDLTRRRYWRVRPYWE